MAKQRITGFNSDARKRIGDTVRKVEAMGPRMSQPLASDTPRDENLNCVMVLNSTGYDLRAGDAVILGEPSQTAAVDANVRYYTSPAPITANYYKPWGVAIGPLKDGKFEQVQLSGVATCYATISDSIERPYLAPIGTGGKLKPSWWGPAEIVYADIASNAEKLVLARLGVLQTPIYKAVTKASISPTGSGNVGLHYSGSERETVTAHLNWMEGVTSIANGTECLIRWFPDEAKWVIINAEC